MFHFMSNPRPPDSILDVTPGQEVDSSAINTTPGKDL